MLTTTEATEAIARAMRSCDHEPVSLEGATGRVLRQVVKAERDQPPFDRVTMDGIACRSASLRTNSRKLTIQGTQFAGDPVQSLLGVDDCIEVMTGAVLPIDADCVIPVERLTVQGKLATVDNDYVVNERQFIHPQGSDYREGQEILHPGNVLTPMDIATIASCGLNTVRVSKLPKISIVSTGNELVAPGLPIDAHQIRLSNGPALRAMFAAQGIVNVEHEHVADDEQTLSIRLASLLADSDVLVLSGGVSMGKADFVPRVLEGLGVHIVFHKISQRPGKPMWFGIGAEKQAVFALPGNPVSALVCCRQYVLPAIFSACGRLAPPQQYAVLSEDVVFKADLTCFMPVRITSPYGGITFATPIQTNTSGDFAALSGTDGYVELVKEQSEFAAGTSVLLHLWNTP